MCGGKTQLPPLSAWVEISSLSGWMSAGGEKKPFFPQGKGCLHDGDGLQLQLKVEQAALVQ